MVIVTLLEAWVTDAEIRGMSPKTIRSYWYRIANFMRFLDGKDIFAVNKIDIRDFIEEARKKGHCDSINISWILREARQ